MYMKFAMNIKLVVVFCLAVSTVFGGVGNPGPGSCPDGGKSGGACSGRRCRRTGYTCITNVCCPVRCPSGREGPACSRYNPCKPGYSCKAERCCRDPVCPRRWTEGPSCNLHSGQERCPSGYQCRRNNFCCRPPSLPERCPPVPVVARPLDAVPCEKLVPPPFQCSSDRDCITNTGYKMCCLEGCGRFMMCIGPWMPRKG